MEKHIVIATSAESREEQDHQDILMKMMTDMGFEVFFSAPSVGEGNKEKDDFTEAVSRSLKEAREKISAADCVLVDWDGENPDGLFEAGVAFEGGKAIVTLASGYEDVPATLKGVSDEVIFYENYAELKQKLSEYFAKLHII